MKYHICNYPFVCGVDLHSKMMYVCIMKASGEVLLHQKIMNHETDKFESVLAPYKGKIVVSAESSFSYYFLADLCEDIGVDFFLGHALYMSHIHGAKTKNDRIDSQKIAELTHKNYLPYAYTCSRETRYVRDLMRSRSAMLKTKTAMINRVKLQTYQSNLPMYDSITKEMIENNTIVKDFKDDNLKFTVNKQLETILLCMNQVREIEKHVESNMHVLYKTKYKQLLQIRGFGLVTAATILLEIDNISRFKNCKHFVSYCRLVKCAHESAGKKIGTGNSKIGNPHLRHIFGEAVVYLSRHNKEFQKYLNKLTQRYGKGKSLTILAHKLARAVYHILKSGEEFQMKHFLRIP